MMEVVDFARFTPPDTMTPEAMQCWRDHYVTTTCIGGSYNPFAEQQATIVKHYGFDIEVYGFPEKLFDATLFALAQNAKLFWIDLEDQTGITITDGFTYVHNAIASAESLLAGSGIEVVLYTNPDWWGRVMGNTTNTFGKRLIYANYNGKPYIDWEAEHFGGWLLTDIVRKQYSPAGLCGVNVDLSTSEVKDDMTVDDVNKLIDAKIATDVYPKIGAILTTLGEQGRALVAIGGALAHHIATHPGGGASVTMAADLDDMLAKVNKLESEEEDLAAKVAAIGKAASGG